MDYCLLQIRRVQRLFSLAIPFSLPLFDARSFKRAGGSTTTVCTTHIPGKELQKLRASTKQRESRAYILPLTFQGESERRRKCYLYSRGEWGPEEEEDDVGDSSIRRCEIGIPVIRRRRYNNDISKAQKCCQDKKQRRRRRRRR